MEIEIEIKTKTTVKLTSLMVNQMQRPTWAQLRFGEVLGYLIQVKRDSYKAILIKCANEYFVISSSWHKKETSVCRCVEHWSMSINFNTSDGCDRWWSAYQDVLDNAKTQIYV